MIVLDVEIFQMQAEKKQECIPVGCVPPASCPYLPACTAPGGVPARGVYLVPGGCTCPGGVPGPGVCTWSRGVYLLAGDNKENKTALRFPSFVGGGDCEIARGCE